MGAEKIMSKLKEIRLERKMTQLEVSKEVGVSIMSYQGWERGGFKPNSENLKKLSEVLEVSEEKLREAME